MDNQDSFYCEPHGFLEFFKDFFKQPVCQAYQRLTDMSEGFCRSVECIQKIRQKTTITGRLEAFKATRMLFLIYINDHYKKMDVLTYIC